MFLKFKEKEKMHERYSFYGMVLIGVTCLSIIVLSRRYNINDENSLQTIVLVSVHIYKIVEYV